jgi:hypothetical protein
MDPEVTEPLESRLGLHLVRIGPRFAKPNAALGKANVKGVGSMRGIVVSSLLLFLFVTVVVGWSDRYSFPNVRSIANAFQQSDSARRDELLRMIKAEVGEPAAKSPSQCKTIALGSKPCGGPATYLVYSTAGSDEDKLKQLVSEYNELSRKYHREHPEIMSDCMFVAEPKVELSDGLCKIKALGPGPIR